MTMEKHRISRSAGHAAFAIERFRPFESRFLFAILRFGVFAATTASRTFSASRPKLRFNEVPCGPQSVRFERKIQAGDRRWDDSGAGKDIRVSDFSNNSINDLNRKQRAKSVGIDLDRVS